MCFCTPASVRSAIRKSILKASSFPLLFYEAQSQRLSARLSVTRFKPWSRSVIRDKILGLDWLFSHRIILAKSLCGHVQLRTSLNYTYVLFSSRIGYTFIVRIQIRCGVCGYSRLVSLGRLPQYKYLNCHGLAVQVEAGWYIRSQRWATCLRTRTNFLNGLFFVFDLKFGCFFS